MADYSNAAQMHKAFPLRVQTVTQDKAELERLYPKGGDGKSTETTRKPAPALLTAPLSLTLDSNTL